MEVFGYIILHRHHWVSPVGNQDSLASECVLSRILCTEVFDTIHSLACIPEMFVIPACVVIMRYIRESTAPVHLGALVTDIEM